MNPFEARNKEEREFLVLLRNKINLLIPKISITGPLIEIDAMIAARLQRIQEDISG